MEAYLKKKQHPLRIFCFQDKNVDFPQEVLGIPAVNVVSPSANNAPDHGIDAGIAYFASWLVIWTGKNRDKNMYIPENQRLEANNWWFVRRFFSPFFKGQTFFQVPAVCVWKGGYNLHSLMSFLKRGWWRLRTKNNPIDHPQPPQKKGNKPRKTNLDTLEWCVWKVGDSFYSKYGNFFGSSYISGVLCNFHILAPRALDKYSINYQLNNLYNLQMFPRNFSWGSHGVLHGEVRCVDRFW